MTVLRTARLVLRPARADDLAAMHAVLSDAAAMRYWSEPPHPTPERTRAWLADMIAIPPGEGEDFVIERDGAVIGKAGLHRFPTIGYILHRDAWGQGYAAEALAAVIACAFTHHRLPRIIADVDPRNARSLRLLERLGFTVTGTRERSWLVGDEWCDSIDLALDAEAWLSQQRGVG